MSVQDKRVKLVVDIDKDTYKEIKRGKIYSSSHDVPLESVLAIANGISLSKDITNGEVLCILFPDMRIHFTMVDKSVRVVTTIGVASSFDLDWWNASFKTESEEKT